MKKKKKKTNISRSKTPIELGKKTPNARSGKWILRLYIAGETPKAVAAFHNLKLICEEQLKGRYSIQVINLLEKPQLARDNQILAVPTLVRKLPVPVRKIIGDLSDTERVLVGLDLVGHHGLMG